jgi:hypothetical protein
MVIEAGGETEENSRKSRTTVGQMRRRRTKAGDMVSRVSRLDGYIRGKYV